MSQSYGNWCLLDHYFSSQRPMFSLSRGVWNPPVDISETADRVIVRMEIAGVRLGDLTVSVERSVLTIRGRRTDRVPESDETVHIMEIRYGRFERSFRLPENLSEDGIEARFRDGFLDIEIPKGRSRGRSRRIEIHEK